jgi:hypothetical protein
MSNQGQASLPNLFKQWRGGDAVAGQEMARRFSDWYYAITVSRLGEFDGREPLKRSCDRFASEIVKLNSASKLMDWAQSIIQEELEAAGGRIAGGDFPNALTEKRSPSELLAAAWGELPYEQLQLLSHAYDASYPLDKLQAEAELAGGYPIAVLRARLDLKRWLRDARGVPLAVVPDEPDLDCAPMPIYEAGRMTTPIEEARFERWMLSRFDLCRDVAEFAVFSLAIRAGALRDSAPPPPAELAPQPTEERPAVPTDELPAAPAAKAPTQAKPSGGGLSPALLVGGVFLAAVLAVAVLAGLYFLFLA